MLRSLAFTLWIVVSLPVISPPAEPPGASLLAPLPFGGGGNPESSAVAVPGKIDLAPAAGFS